MNYIPQQREWWIDQLGELWQLCLSYLTPAQKCGSCIPHSSPVDEPGFVCFPASPPSPQTARAHDKWLEKINNMKCFYSSSRVGFVLCSSLCFLFVFFYVDRRSVPRMASTESRTEDNPYDYRHLLRKTSQRRKLIKQYWTAEPFCLTCSTRLQVWFITASAETFETLSHVNIKMLHLLKVAVNEGFIYIICKLDVSTFYSFSCSV